ncbi:RNA polymerase sigma factor [Lentzea rhizosphaerae]|jgi:hypothetical protein|uniref:RNA polymerase sigma factor n=1 Tax=Lentzea rhizosphaerae TaxID=2041025 RepID=A0ABV8BZB1_9PSEU|nr:hypothetical protein [Lentzea aerocolonigenes]MCP2245077.1 hypothetical protein [Lentzea aerocolonigenes]
MTTHLRVLRGGQDDDSELVARLRAGDWTALDALYGRYSLPVFQRCWRVLRTRHTSWEATHDTFATYLAQLPSVPPREWLLATGSRLAHARRGAR